MREHAWRAGANGTESCSRQGCVIIRYAEGGVWQRKKGGHWRRVASEAIPECKGKEVVSERPAAINGSAGFALLTEAAPEQNPTMFDKVRWALWHLRDGEHVDVVGVGKALDALAALGQIDRTMPALMDAYHGLERIPDNHAPPSIPWQECPACRALLESK